MLLDHDPDLYMKNPDVEIDISLIRLIASVLPSGQTMSDLVEMLNEVEARKQSMQHTLRLRLADEAEAERDWAEYGFCNYCKCKANFSDWRALARNRTMKGRVWRYTCPDCRVCQSCGGPEYGRIFDDGTRLCNICIENQRILRELKRVVAHNKRAWKINEVGNLLPRQWFHCLTFFSYRCAYCESAFECIEHFVSIGQGTGTTVTNCLPSCNNCNGSKRSGKFPPHTSPDVINRIQQYWNMCS